MKKFIWQHSNWPDLYWDNQVLASLIIKSRQKQSFLLGAANMLGFDLKLQAQGVIKEVYIGRYGNLDFRSDRAIFY